MGSGNSFLKGIAVGAASLIALAAGAGLITIYTGAYNVAASDDHTPLVRWAFEKTLHNSVERQADGIAVPALTADMARAGASHYKAMCQHCHAGPGVDRAEWAQGLLPMPPLMTKAAKEWQPNQVFWIVKHGLKMSGMPAFGDTHDDRTLWNIVAFVKALPDKSPGQYASVGNEGHHDAAAGGGAEQGHGPPGHHD